MSHGERDKSSVNRGIRIDEVRGVEAQTTRNPGGAHTLNDLAEEADMAAAEGSTWGEAIKVDPYDLGTFLLDFTAGADTTSVEIRAQISEYENKIDAVWHDLYIFDPAAGSFTRWTGSFVTTTSVQIGFSTPVRAKYMRFQLFAPGADQTGSRAVLKAVLDKNGV